MSRPRYFGIVATFVALAVTAMGTAATSVSDLSWRYRVIAVFAKTAPEADHARHEMNQASGITERDIAWLVVHDDTVASNLGQPPDAADLYKLHRGTGFEAVLIGKDGTVKARQRDFLDIGAFKQQIDAMPMRQREMRNRRRSRP